MITTGFDLKKYSWKNSSLEGKGTLSHVEATLTGPELESLRGSKLCGTRYKFSNIFSLAIPPGDKRPSSCLNVSHFVFRNASNSSAVFDPGYD